LSESEPSAFGPYDAESPPPIEFEQWASLSASLLQRDEEAQLAILASQGIDPDVWDACNLFWATELAKQVDEGNLTLASRYGTICSDELQQRAAHEPQATPLPNEDSTDETGFFTQLPKSPALPFQPDPFADASARTADQPADTQPASPVGGVDETAFVAVVEVEEPLPFAPPSEEASGDPRDK